MNKLVIFITVILLIIGAAIFLFDQDKKPPEIKATISVTDILLNKAENGFARAISPRKFLFPDDHGPHPEFQSEWWYFTGNLDAENGEHFGFQLTIFRNALSPDSAHRDSP